MDAVPLEESVLVAPIVPAAELLESPEWLSVPGPPPERPGMLSAVDDGVEAPEDVPEGLDAPNDIFSPVASNEPRIVGSLPSTTVLLRPELEL